ncbi:actin-like protein 9 [Hemicordylus capensis]|uniref:actin-like protein 9 n=1 Tax=Hemicordylus capensis TaxID=884348 RepID=UPI0023020E36|nr:actin-like protein 9 [Hemicordylus capensis]
MSFRSGRSKSPGPSRKRSPGPARSKSPAQRSVSPGCVRIRTPSPGYPMGQSARSRASSKERGSTKMRSRTPERDIVKTGAVVIDTGTGTCKAGFAGQQTPQSVIGTLVGHPTEKSMRTRRDRPDTYVGERARTEPDLDVILPVRHGIIVDWEAAEVLWRHLFYHDLQVAPEDHALLMSDPPLCPTTNREKLVEVVFESLNSPGMYVAYQSVLSVYAHGKISGMVVDTGYAVTHTVPVHQGYNLPHATERMDIGGTNITSFLMNLLRDMGHYFDERMLDVVADIKQKCCYVALDFDAEWNRPRREYMVDYQLPDGQIISMGKERFQCPEMLFNPPQMPGLNLVGIHGMAQRSLRKVPEEHRKDMYENIMLCGGSSLFEGLEKRFTHELMAMVPTNTKVKVTANPLRKYSVWTGGSILASLRNFQPCWIRKEQYQESGPYIVHRKCY